MLCIQLSVGTGNQLSSNYHSSSCYLVGFFFNFLIKQIHFSILRFWVFHPNFISFKTLTKDAKTKWKDIWKIYSSCMHCDLKSKFLIYKSIIVSIISCTGLLESPKLENPGVYEDDVSPNSQDNLYKLIQLHL